MVVLKKKQLLNVDESDFTLTKLTHYVLEKRQRHFQEAGDKKYRSEGFHLSSSLCLEKDNARYCSREIEITRRYADELEPWQANNKLQVIFDIGHELHSMSQKYWRDLGFFARDEENQIVAGLYGRWACRACGKIWTAFAPMHCVACKAELHSLKYLEYRFSNKRWDIKSTTDGLLWIYNEEKREWFEYIIEVKSIKQNQQYYGDVGFVELQEPLPKHYIQAQGYGHLRRLQHESGMKNKKLPRGFKKWPTFKKQIIFFYLNKNGGDFKEYRVDLDMRVWTLLTKRIGRVQEHEKAGTLSERIPACKSLAVAKSKVKCNVAEKCFRLHDDRASAAD